MITKTEILNEFLAITPGIFRSKLYLDISNFFRGEFRVLDLLSTNSDQVKQPGDLARELGISPARISLLLKKMEDKGYIIRMPDQSNHRQTIVEATEEGKDIFNQKKEQIEQNFLNVIENLNPEDLSTFFYVAKKLFN